MSSSDHYLTFSPQCYGLVLEKMLSVSYIHYENMPILIYWKFTTKKNKNFQTKNSDIFHIEAVPTSTHNLCFSAEIRKIMYTPVNPIYIIYKWGLRGSKLYRHVFVIYGHSGNCVQSCRIIWKKCQYSFIRRPHLKSGENRWNGFRDDI